MRFKIYRGEESRTAKLTDADVRLLLELDRQGWGRKQLAERFQISTMHVGHIVRGESWRHIDRETVFSGRETAG